MIRKRTLHLVFLCLIFFACNSNKNLAQSSNITSNDTLIQYINQSKKDTVHINSTLKKIANENDLMIAFASLNYAWTRTGTYHVLAYKNKEWKLYSFQLKLPFSSTDTATTMSSINVSYSDVEKVKQLYATSQLWKINGNENNTFCNDKKDCNITDADTWALTVATPQNIHTTTYYAPEFFERCCPGNPYRQRFVAIAKKIVGLANNNNSM